MASALKLTCAALAVAMLVSPAAAQNRADGRIASQPLRLFLDCQTHCFFDHVRREIAFVDYVRDREVADLHVLVTSQRTGGDGNEFRFTFIGLGRFTGRNDTLLYVSTATDTEDEMRDGQTQTLKLGLMRYVANSPVADRITISYRPPADETTAQEPVDDPWNLWVYRISAGGSIRSESLTRDLSANGTFSANRVTEKLKLQFFARGSVSESRFELEDDSILIDTRTDYRLEALMVHSIGNEHWAAGGGVSLVKSTRFNQKSAWRALAALEYSIFPYSESTRRSVRLLYLAGLGAFNYDEITIFGETAEVRGEQTLTLEVEAVQPWGSIFGSVEGFTYLHDLARHRVELSGFLSLRIVRGLELNGGGSIARIKDQIYLPGADIPEEDILLRRRQLGTDFRIRTNFSLSFRFGSIFNNVVNPRIDF